jgi:hypothetical protein
MRSTRARGPLFAAILAGLVIAAPAWAAPAAGSVTRPAGQSAAALPAPVPCNTTAGPCWQPPLVSRWQYQLQGSINSAGQCIHPNTGFINTGITGTSFATGQQVTPTVFDIDIYQDGKCYTPNNYGVLNTAAVNAVHAQGDKVIGYIDAGTAETWRPDYPQYQSCAGLTCPRLPPSAAPSARCPLSASAGPAPAWTWRPRQAWPGARRYPPLKSSSIADPLMQR